jgi:hypothetical protein
MKKPSFTELMSNAFAEIRAWKLTSLVLASLCAVLAICVIYEANSRTTVLIPANVAVLDGPVKVSPSGAFGNTSPNYLSQIALGDLSLILDWQPSNVQLQYERFLNRCTPSLYARENVRLLAKAAKHQAGGESQSFYPDITQVNLKTGQVIVDGYLVRWTGGKQLVKVRQRFIVTYRMQDGYLHVADIQTK